MNKFISVCLMVFGIFFVAPAAANLDKPPTAAEKKAWPQVCQDRWKYGDNRKSTVVARWRDILGEDYVHLHHYCLGLNYVNRANRSWNNKKNMTYFLSKAVGNLNYMITHTKQSFALRPDIYVQLGKVYARQGKVGDAITQFQNAIRLKKDYTKAYIALSDFYKKNKNRSEALKVIEEGLKYAPNSKSLKRRQRKLSK